MLIDKIFSEALKYFVQFEKSRKIFAAKVGISVPYLNDLVNGRRNGEDGIKRKIAAGLGYPDRHFEDFLDIGRIILAGTAAPEGEKYSAVSDEAMVRRGFLPVAYSDNMFLGPDNLIQITNDVQKSRIIIHGPSLYRNISQDLQAFKVPDSAMEEVIAEDSIVVADLTKKKPENIKDGQIYIVCLKTDTGQCTLRYLTMAGKKEKFLIIEPENRKYTSFVHRFEEIKIIGRVIMNQRYFQ